MDTIRLRFIAEDDHYEFEASPHQFPLQINNAFIAFKKQTGYRTGQLQLHHHIHGWHLICINQTYPIISNPAALDFEVLASAIYETVVMINQWPDPEDEQSTEKTETSGSSHLRVVK